jgi:hypothetical protein
MYDYQATAVAVLFLVHSMKTYMHVVPAAPHGRPPMPGTSAADRKLRRGPRCAEPAAAARGGPSTSSPVVW